MYTIECPVWPKLSSIIAKTLGCRDFWLCKWKELRRANARARHIQHNLETSDHPATCYMRVDVIAQLAVNSETSTELHRPSIRGLCICFFVLREILWPVETCLDQRNPPHTATTQGVKNKSICTEILVVVIRISSVIPCLSFFGSMHRSWLDGSQDWAPWDR